MRGWLERAGLSALFRWVITSVDARARKPAPQFFQDALGRCGLAREDVLFVGNQLNTDVSGAEAFGIPTAWLSRNLTITALTMRRATPRRPMRFERSMICRPSCDDWTSHRTEWWPFRDGLLAAAAGAAIKECRPPSQGALSHQRGRLEHKAPRRLNSFGRAGTPLDKLDKRRILLH